MILNVPIDRKAVISLLSTNQRDVTLLKDWLFTIIFVRFSNLAVLVPELMSNEEQMLGSVYVSDYDDD